MRLIIDSHLDIAWNALSFNRDQTMSVAQIREAERSLKDDRSRGHGMVSLPDMRRGGVMLCMATLLARVKPSVWPERGFMRTDLDYAHPSIAYATAQGQLAYYRQLEVMEEISLIASRSELDAHWARCQEATDLTDVPVGVILAMEGTDPIVSPSQSDQWWDNGLRVASLVHFGEGPYAFGTGSDGPVSESGFQLLAEFERLGMILDTTHLCDTSWYQATDAFSGTIIASHNNCRSVTPGGRQFSDDQLSRIIQRNGIIGIAFHTAMLSKRWIRDSRSDIVGVTIADAVDHIDHICQLAGNAEHVSFGTDLDGGFGTQESPCDMDTIADLQKFDALLTNRGYADDDIELIFNGNWLRLLRTCLPS